MPAARASGPDQEPGSARWWDMSVSPPTAGGVFTGSANRSGPVRTAVGLWSEGTVTARLSYYDVASTGLTVAVGADVCEGGAPIVVAADGVEVLRAVVDADYAVYSIPHPDPDGMREITIAYTEDRWTSACDRNLKVYAVGTEFGGWGAQPLQLAGPGSLVREPAGAGTTYTVGHDGAAASMLWSPGSLSRTVTTPAYPVARLAVLARGQACEGDPELELSIDGVLVGTVTVPSGTAWPLVEAPVTVPLAAGPHELRVTYLDDLRTAACDRNVSVQAVYLFSERSPG
ncbi:MAG TPA: carbohydrate-binding domain-containing protein [Cellulomonas sp.]